MILRLAIVVLVGSLSLVSARADEQSDAEARRLYEQGRGAFEKHEYQRAYDAFKRSYLISQRPELLFNMSSALKELARPHEAADELRAYLRVVPETPDRVEIEQRILTLEESQRLLDQECARKAPPPETPNMSVAPAAAATAATANPMVAAPPPPPHKRRTALFVGLGVGAAVVVGALAVGLGVGLSHDAAPAPTSSTFGTIRATP